MGAIVRLAVPLPDPAVSALLVPGKPLAIVHSEAAAVPQGVRIFPDGHLGVATPPMLEDVTRFDFRDNPGDVTRDADTVADHLRANAEG